jgi:predicted Zn-dependent peptidase
MEGVYYQHRLGKEINLYLIREPKFKTVSVSLIMYRPLDENSTGNALLPQILKRGCEGFADTKSIEEFLGRCYGASLNVDVFKKGDMQLIYLGSNVISDKYTLKGEGVVSDILGFLVRLITKPLIDETGFKKAYFDQERDNIKRLIDARINDKIHYSIERCYEETTKGQPFSRYKYGDAKELEGITAVGLAEYYKTMLSEVPIDIFVVGDVDIADLKAFLDIPPAVERRDIKYPAQALSPRPADAPREVIESMDVNQGKLTMSYTTGIGYSHESYVPLLVYASILGGGAHSKLFNNVREKASLAYYSFARLEKLKGLMVIGSGIEIANYNKTLEIIEQQLEDMRKGRISKGELEAAQRALINNIHSMKDNKMHITDLIIDRIVSGYWMTPDGLIDRIGRVTREEIVDVAGSVKHAVTYFLTAGEKAPEEGKV